MDFRVSLLVVLSLFSCREAFAHNLFSNTVHVCRSFTFHDGLSRDDARDIISTNSFFYDEETLEVMQPKSWSHAEIEKICAVIENLYQSIPAFMSVIETTGMTKFYRYKTGVNNEQLLQFERRKSLDDLWYGGVPPEITENESIPAATVQAVQGYLIFNYLFNIPPPKENFPSEFEISLLHELAHAYYSHMSDRENWARLIGWNNETQGFQFFEPGSTQFHLREILNNVFPSHLPQEQLHERLRFAQLLASRYGFPTIYAMSNDIEAFAEWVAYGFYQPDEASWADPDVYAFIRDNILR